VRELKAAGFGTAVERHYPVPATNHRHDSVVGHHPLGELIQRELRLDTFSGRTLIRQAAEFRPLCLPLGLSFRKQKPPQGSKVIM
jgi:hypothetical protein